MKSLLILRHAKSSWNNTNLADFERPLKKRGKRDAPRMGVLLKEEGIVPDLILSSPAERALATAEATALAAGYEAEIQTTPELYHGGPENYIEVLNGVSDDYQRVMVVGHNPGIESLVEELTGEWIRMPTAALALISLEISRWSELDLDYNQTLVDVWRPRELS